MKKIYTHENRMMVWSVKNALEREGFQCEVRNEYAGGGVGDLSPFETWPEVWLVDDWQYEKAQQLIQEQFAPKERQLDWRCAACGEVNGDAFEVCWNCGRDR
jgi:hypothetical protein